MVAAAITPTSDGLIVLTNGGKLSRAFGVHGLTQTARRGGSNSGAGMSEACDARPLLTAAWRSSCVGEPVHACPALMLGNAGRIDVHRAR
jgi:hypothetical protein